MKKQHRLILIKQYLCRVPTKHREPVDHFYIL